MCLLSLLSLNLWPHKWAKLYLKLPYIKDTGYKEHIVEKYNYRHLLWEKTITGLITEHAGIPSTGHSGFYCCYHSFLHHKNCKQSLIQLREWQALYRYPINGLSCMRQEMTQVNKIWNVFKFHGTKYKHGKFWLDSFGYLWRCDFCWRMTMMVTMITWKKLNGCVKHL